MAKAKLTASLHLEPGVLARVKALLRGAPKHVHNHRLSTGIHEGEAHAKKVQYDGRAAAIDLIEAAAIQEFGDRSWLRTWFDQNEPRLKEEATAGMRAEYQGDPGAIQTLAKKWGHELADWIQTGEANLKALQPATIAARTKAGLPAGPPLFATGQLVKAIRAMADAEYVV